MASLITRGWNFLGRKLRKYAYDCLLSIPYFAFIKHTQNTPVPITLKMWWDQKVLRKHKGVYWPVHHSSKINQYKNICIGVETSPGYQPGCYIQGLGKVIIGDYTRIAPNVGIISGNHDVYDTREYKLGEVIIGSYCWIGMNSVVLPGVVLGDFTIVGAGSVVTKSFDEGYCVIGGNPARIVKKLDSSKCVKYQSDHAYIGFIPKEKFNEYRKKNLWI